MVMADEHQLWLAFYLHEHDPDWDGTYVRLVDESSEELCAIVHFKGVHIHMFGPPDEMRTHMHPLGQRGLQAYMSAEVKNSSWIRELKAFHAKAPNHWPHAYDNTRHFIFAFHDSCFECVAKSFEISVMRSSVVKAIAAAINQT